MLQCDREMEEESKFGFVDYTIGQDNDNKQQDAITNMAGTFKKLAVWPVRPILLWQVSSETATVTVSFLPRFFFVTWLHDLVRLRIQTLSENWY